MPIELAEQLEKLIGLGINFYTKTPARAALHWAAMLDTGVSMPVLLEDPFEPSSSCSSVAVASPEVGFIDLGSSSVLLKTWRDYLGTEAVTNLDQASLDALDVARPDNSAPPLPLSSRQIS